MAAKAEDASTAAAVGKAVMVVGIDDSEHSFYALQWTLLHFFSPAVRPSWPYKLVIVSAKPTPTSVISVASPVTIRLACDSIDWVFVLTIAGAADVLPFVESDLRKISSQVIEKAKDICAAHSVTSFLIRLNRTVFIFFSCRAVLGSVSDYCAHHAHCTVMIVKKPKPKH
ncbi:hypothetical protein BHE74_00005129 [Ensete ventricosum]|nr:hypothetical protein GW17_00000010 [Ensete ventricosum]RWW86118.1 hypothetical protein BHE74_00005129 [Ensete ventricosum]RZR79708.1 hypothetical protein BHM03_00005499 [Ensete ventricosum]